MSSDAQAEQTPDVRDGLTRQERAVLFCLYQLQRERGDGPVPTAMLYGRVVEQLDMSVAQMQAILARFNAPGFATASPPADPS